MKFSLVSFGSLAFVVSASAQYFSEGWAPGQTVTTEAAAPTFIPDNPAAASAGGLAGLFDISKILKSEPLVSLFQRAGLNITEKLEGAIEKSKLWDDRVPLITDDNYGNLIVNEPLTEQEERNRVWVIVISVTAAKQDGGISKFLDSAFDTAYNETQIAGDLPHVRWGRIDYLNVTTITTKWAIWQAPYLVILKDRGQTLRFYKAHQLRLRDGAMRDFLIQDGWKVTKPWSTAYAPGGSREYIMDFFAKYMTIAYNFVIMFPRWLLFLVSGSIASVAINLLHRSSNKEAAKKQSQPKALSTPPPQLTSPISPSPVTKRGSAKQRKGKK